MSAWVAGAIAVGAVVGGTAAYLGSKEVGDATEAAAESTAESVKDTNALQKEMYDQTREDQEPWRLAGEQALTEIQNTPDFQFEDKDFDFFTDPSYDFRKQEGIDALDRSAASRGRVLSGAQDRAVTRYGSDLASQEYQNAFARHQSGEAQRYDMEKSEFDTNLNTQKSLAGVGQQSVNQLGQAGQNMANSVSNTTMSGVNSANALTMSGVNAQNALAMQGAQTQANMYTGLATSANQGIGNYLLYQSLA